MEFEEIKDRIFQYSHEGKRIFTTSSFQTHSLVLLHIISRVDRNIPVFFINTGYHFSETITFKNYITDLFGLKTIDLRSNTPKNLQKTPDGRLLFTSDPDYCCYLNKIEPVDNILREYNVWINGIRRDQNANRHKMNEEAPAPHDTVRFHPLLDWDNKKIFQYRKEFNLPYHPLESQGYLSIGCEPCTRKWNPEQQERNSRWFGMKKTECGLHTDLLHK